MMAQLPELFVECLLAAGFCGLAIIALARLIPRQIIAGFEDQIVEHGYTAPPVREGDFKLSTTAKTAILVGSCLAGLLVAGISATPLDAALSGFYLFVLILLAAINLKYLLLPDIVLFPALWIGLLAGVHAGQAAEHVLGAMAAYIGPFMLIFLMRLRGKADFIGMGDLKALAMAGAWFGLAAVPQILAVFFVLLVLQLLLLVALPGRITAGTGMVHIAASLSWMMLPHML